MGSFCARFEIEMRRELGFRVLARHIRNYSSSYKVPGIQETKGRAKELKKSRYDFSQGHARLVQRTSKRRERQATKRELAHFQDDLPEVSHYTNLDDFIDMVNSDPCWNDIFDSPLL